MRGTFVISDLETTGLSRRDEILELAAIRADATGHILAQFSMLVQIRGTLSPKISEITGITRALLWRRGVPLRDALTAYLQFCGTDPVFFHNAGFDRRFLTDAATRLTLPFENQVLCSLKIARAAWPDLPSHTLQALSRHLGTSAPTHRGLADVVATLEILLEACPL